MVSSANLHCRLVVHGWLHLCSYQSPVIYHCLNKLT